MKMIAITGSRTALTPLTASFLIYGERVTFNPGRPSLPDHYRLWFIPKPGIYFKKGHTDVQTNCDWHVGSGFFVDGGNRLRSSDRGASIRNLVPRIRASGSDHWARIRHARAE